MSEKVVPINTEKHVRFLFEELQQQETIELAAVATIEDCRSERTRILGILATLGAVKPLAPLRTEYVGPDELA